MRQKPTIEQEQNQLQVAENLFGYSPCEHCKYFHRGERYFKNPFVSCKAYPKGIPGEIFEGENLHQKPYPGDGAFSSNKIQDILAEMRLPDIGNLYNRF